MDQLANAQQQLAAIDKLSNCIQKVSAGESKEIAYLMHQIIESKEGITSDIARSIQHWQLVANKDLFFGA